MLRVPAAALFGSLGLRILGIGLVLQPLAAQAADRSPQMRVLLHEGPELVLRADGDQAIQVLGLPGGRRDVRRLELHQQAGGLRATVDGRQLWLSQATLLTATNADPRGIWLGQRRYRGELQLSGRGGRLRVINALPIETYLASVVGSEMPQAWPMAALQAQAVAARTYAFRQRKRGGGWDLKATVSSQVYRGVESETPRTREAVDSTRTLVLVHGGQLIDAVFHSSSGGVTEASGMVWRHQLPYLVSVPDHDQHSPVHRWEERFSPAQLQQRLPETGGLKGVDVLARTDSGRVQRARIRGPQGVLLLEGAELRRRLGLKSTLVSFEMVTGQRAGIQPPPPPPLPATPTSPLLARRSWLPPAAGPSRRFQVAPPPLLPPSAFRRPQGLQGPPGPMLLVRGQGYGHGVGMSQWGAHGLAEQGADFRTILRHYYRGAEVVSFSTIRNPSLALRAAPKPRWRG
ncbi:MAG: SpoIID/LytB domain-containing protein [Synechococcus sp.]